MKYLKTFEAYESKSLAREIAEDLLPRIEKIRAEKGKFTIPMFDEYMKERDANLNLIDEIISELTDMGFDFDSEDDDMEIEFDDDDDDDGFEGYPGLEYSLN